MKKVREWILSKFTIDRILIFNGDLENYVKLLNSIYLKEKFDVTRLEDNNFKITAKSSLGLLLINGFQVTKGITVFLTTQSIDSNCLTIRLRTKIRIEIYFCCLILIAFLIGMVLNIDEFPFWTFIIPIVPIFWFNWIYMLQGKALVEEIIKYFNIFKHKKVE